MKKLSRRQFVKWCFYAAASGLGILYLSSFAKKEKTSPASKFEPSYLSLHENGQLRKRGQHLWQIMKSCQLCPRRCGANRLAEEQGFCQSSSQLQISSYQPHFGEERPLVGRGGSGAIFFTNCSLRCVFCINWEISQEGKGKACSIDDLAQMMMNLQAKGCHNINLVTPTHYLAHIVLAVDKAAAKGLRLPLVYNTCGWERLEMLEVLDGIIDIYLPDFKYSSGAMAAKYSSGAQSYPEVTQKALLAMQRQVGVALVPADGVMRRGLMIRHLVMPAGVSGTKEVIEWIAANLPKNTYLNLMSQYQPFYKAFTYPEISRRITVKEYKDVIFWANEAALTNVHLQGMIGLLEGSHAF